LNSCVTGRYGVAIGDNARNCAIVDGGNFGILIGRNLCGSGYNPLIIGGDSCASGAGTFIGFQGCATDGSIVMGLQSCAANSGSVVIGYNSKSFGERSIVLGFQAQSCAVHGIAIGNTSRATVACSIAMGCNACVTHTGATVIGPGLTSEKTNTVHVDNLITYGQAASKTHTIGNTGGTVTVNFDNGNVQTLTLTSSITSLTKSNPIDGGVYTLFLKQGGAGSNTVAWGADVDWAGATAPALSTAIGAVDAISMVYIAGVTGYYANINKNFA
jgi:hypothetical protein